MSDQLTSQSRSNASAITRRTALRGAAWSASAVTVVVATPNIAAATPGTAIAPKATVTGGTPEKYSDKSAKFVAWDIKVTNTGMELKRLTLLLTFNQSGGGTTPTLDDVVVRNIPAASAWSATVTKRTMSASSPATATAVYGGAVAVGSTADIHVQFQGSDNSSGVVSVNVMAENSRGELVSVGSLGIPQPISWGSGNIHSH